MMKIICFFIDFQAFSYVYNHANIYSSHFCIFKNNSVRKIVKYKIYFEKCQKQKRCDSYSYLLNMLSYKLLLIFLIDTKQTDCKKHKPAMQQTNVSQHFRVQGAPTSLFKVFLWSPLGMRHFLTTFQGIFQSSLHMLHINLF